MKCWYTIYGFTKYQLDCAVQSMKKCNSINVNPEASGMDNYGDKTYHEFSTQQTFDMFKSVKGIGNELGIYVCSKFIIS